MTEREMTVMLDGVVRRRLITESALRVGFKSVLDTCMHHEKNSMSYESYLLGLQQSVGMSKLMVLRLMSGLYASIESGKAVPKMDKPELVDVLARVILDEYSKDEIANETNFDFSDALKSHNHDAACHEFLQNTVRMNAMLDVMSDFFAVFTQEEKNNIYMYGKNSVTILARVLNQHMEKGVDYIYQNFLHGQG